VSEARLTVDALEEVAAHLDRSDDYLIHAAAQRLTCLEIDGTRLERVRLAEQCVVDSARLQQSNKATAHWVLAIELLGIGDLGEAVRQAEEVLRLLHDDMAEPIWYLAASTAAQAHLLAGGWDRALELFAPCASRESNAIHLRAIAWQALISWWRGDAELAGQILRDARDGVSLRPSSMGYWQRFLPVLARATLLERVDPVLARSTLRPFLDVSEVRTLEAGGECLVAAARFAWRDSTADLGYREGVRAVASSALVDGPLDAAYLSEVEAHLARAEDAESVETWQRVAAAWDALGVPFATAEAGLHLAEVQVRDGDREGAAVVLARSLELAEGLDARPLADAVRALAARARLRLPGYETASEQARGGLTVREHEVLQELATGRTNDQIAGALFISPKTASVHVSRILAKLGAANRTEVAAIAHRRGLLEP
jgi:DNA-binding NarL/FixJ family response regulator